MKNLTISKIALVIFFIGLEFYMIMTIESIYCGDVVDVLFCLFMIIILFFVNVTVINIIKHEKEINP